MKRRVRTAVRLALVATVLVGGYAYALSPDPLPSVACATEDSTNCVWDADTQGNGQGRSFYDIDGEVTYVD